VAKPFSLYDDALRGVLGFLQLDERARVASVSTQWNRMTALEIVHGACTVHIYRWSDVAGLGRSVMARNHITTLMFDASLTWPSSQAMADFLAPLSSFRRLTDIRFESWGQPPESLTCILRRCSTLRRIHATLLRRVNTPFMRKFLQSRYPMPQLQDLDHIYLDSSLAVRIAKCAPNLTVLNVASPGPTRSIIQPLLALLPHLHHLKKLHIMGMEADVMRANLFANLTRDTLRIVAFLHCIIDKSMLEWFKTLPNLVLLRFVNCNVPDFSAFAHPMLTTFDVYSRNAYPPAWFPQRQLNPQLHVTWE
jgi:hypothetical protein